MTKDLVLSKGAQPSRHRGPRQRIAAAVLAAALAACAPQPRVEPVAGFTGLVAADDARAVAAAGEALGQGGNAGDAAVAAFLALAVVRPDIAGLGAGGVCLLHDPKAKRVEAIEFPPDGAVPAGARGLYAVHARYGLLRWGAQFGAAERLARLGLPASRALAQAVAGEAGRLLADPAARRVFAGAEGRPLAEGQPLVQPELAATLARLRSQGPGDLHVGLLARDFAADAPGEQLRAYQPRLRPTLTAALGAEQVHFAPGPAGEAAAAQWQGLAAGGSQRSVPTPAAAVTGFAVADAAGGAVACAVTMGTPFGRARMAGASGVLVPAGRVEAVPSPILAANPHVGELRLAAAGAVGAAVTEAAALRLVAGRSLAEAVAAAPTPGSIGMIGCASGAAQAARCQAAVRGAGRAETFGGR